MRARILLVGLVAGAWLAAFALPALAKGEGETLQGQAVLTGPGISTPITIGGQTTGYGVYGYSSDGSSSTRSSDFESMLLDVGIFGGGSEIGWYELPPDDVSVLGPAYAATFTVDMPEGVKTIVADVFPFAPDRPMVHFQPKQVGLYGQKIAQWWSAPPELFALLVAHGLPAVPPVAAPAPRDLPQPAAPNTWVWVWTIAALLALMGAGAFLGRRRPAELA